MKNVFVVWAGEYEPTMIAVCTTEAKAKAMIEARKAVETTYHEYYYYESVTLNTEIEY
jgi:hypothetical protein